MSSFEVMQSISRDNVITTELPSYSYIDGKGIQDYLHIPYQPQSEADVLDVNAAHKELLTMVMNMRRLALATKKISHSNILIPDGAEDLFNAGLRAVNIMARSITNVPLFNRNFSLQQTGVEGVLEYAGIKVGKWYEALLLPRLGTAKAEYAIDHSVGDNERLGLTFVYEDHNPLYSFSTDLYRVNTNQGFIFTGYTKGYPRVQDK